MTTESKSPAPQDDEPPVMGAGCGPAPMPTEKEVWMGKYVAYMVAQGIHADDAWAVCRAGDGDHDYTQDPEEAAEAEMEVWTDDGDLA